MTLTWLPNTLTIARIALACVVGWLILTLPATSIWLVPSFVLVALTDFVDGLAARKLNAVSALGAFLDPVADKLLVGLSLLALAATREWTLLLLIPTALILLRDVIATGLRLVPSIEMPVSRLAKWKTALEMIAIVALLLAGPTFLQLLWNAGLVVLWLAALLSVYTLGLYLGALIADSKRPRS
ncbi:MAG: CDP-diacylglycerol--glycerol-3-phosphate 3-phosphatidyltransferase [Pseudomonadota bacterium]